MLMKQGPKVGKYPNGRREGGRDGSFSLKSLRVGVGVGVGMGVSMKGGGLPLSPGGEIWDMLR